MFMKLEIKKKFKEAFALVYDTLILIVRNIKPILIFVLLYAIFNISACDIVFDVFCSIGAKIIGIDYICPDNIVWALTRPTIILIIIIMFVCFSFIAIFEIAGLMHAYSLGHVKKKTTFFGMVDAAIHACEKCLHPRNWLLIFFIIVLFPLTGIITLSSATYSIKIPEFISDFLFANKLYSKLMLILYVVFVFAETIYIFALNFFTLGENNFIKACKESRRLIKGHFLETVICIAATSFAFFVIATSTSAVFSEIIVRISKVGNITGAQKLVQFIGLSKGFFYAVLSPIFNVAAITALFYKYLAKEKSLDKVSKKSFIDTPIKSWRLIRLFIIIGVIYIFGAIFNKDVIKDYANDMNIPEIVAHRGDSVRAPENTMPAIELAAFERNTYIEFDVHRTKDGKILVSHDDNLLRVTGKDVNMHELTYDEAMQLDTGAWFGKEYAGTRFSLLSDVLKFLKDFDMNIQIEIKPSGYGDSELEHDVVKIIKESGIENRCMITCLKLKPLLDIEEFAPEIRTIYSMFVAWGNIEKIDKVDGFTIEEENITETLVKNIHKTNRPCFVWTVNTEDKVQHFVDCGIDGILTDDPIMMRNALISCDYDGGIKKFIRQYLNIMQNGL